MILLRAGRLQEPPPRAPRERERERARAQAGYRSRKHARLLIDAATNGVAGPSRSMRPSDARGIRAADGRGYL
jgi:hypothetical protein